MINLDVLTEPINDMERSSLHILCDDTAMNGSVKGKPAQIIADLFEHRKNVYCVSNGDYSLHQLAQEIVQHMQRVDVMDISTFSFTEIPARILGMLKHDGKIKELNILTDIRVKANYPGVLQSVGIFADKVALTKVHAKVTLFANDQYKVTIIGSANWTTNPRYEVAFITLSEDIYSFQKQWIDTEIINKLNVHTDR